MSPRLGNHCLKESRYGTCYRTVGHRSVCATFIGPPAFWFAWNDDGSHIGYGHFSHGRFQWTAS
jgi:hypothetical protein